MKKHHNEGFTLMELMVVVIIVAIMAAIAIPLYAVPRKRAMSSEGMTGIGVVQTYLRGYFASEGEYTDDMDTLIPSRDSLDGNFFDHENYSVELVDDGYIITCEGTAGTEVEGIVLSLDSAGSWNAVYN